MEKDIWTSQLSFKFSFLIIETLQQPSPSIKPVTYQGCNLGVTLFFGQQEQALTGCCCWSTFGAFLTEENNLNLFVFL